MTLTDGGVGDGDGVANGRIVDPGGPAILPSGDRTPPVVTGVATRAPNANGWYSAAVRIRWTATDPSGIAVQPASTLVSNEGNSVTAVSPVVCDRAVPANCGTGQVTGLRIDRTAPTVTVNGVANGGTYVLGGVPARSCTATDGLSGLAAPCATTSTGGNSNGVGSYRYTVRATDRAGNQRVNTVNYRVIYRVDGFLDPLNDPAISPGVAMSVFRRPSNVPVAFQVRRSDGSTVTPVTPPSWLTPTRGARTSAAVNEASYTGAASAGSSYAWRNSAWRYDWSTRNATVGYAYRLGVRLDDGTTRYLWVGLR